MPSRKKDDETAVALRPTEEIEAYDFGDDAGEGFEDQTSADFSIQFIYVLQGLSPQCEDESLGARPGMLFNNVTEELYSGSEGFDFIPVFKRHVFNEWVPRLQGGGFVGVHQVGSDVVKVAKENSTEFGKYSTKDGNDLIETVYIYGLLLDEYENTSLVVIPFTSTKLGVYQKWNTRIDAVRIRGKKPPLYAHRVKITTIKEERAKGVSYNVVLKGANGSVKESLLPPGSDLIEQAKAARELIKAEINNINYGVQERDPDASPTEKTVSGDAEDVPF